MKVSDRPNRTWLCSVVFMDIANYTTHSIEQQILMKNKFTEIVHQFSRQDFSEPDLFTVDAGDGAALCYLGDPEDMLFCARHLMEAFIQVADSSDIQLPVRIGINLGSVKIHTNVAGQPNPIGDGINVAQRIMSFADAGQIMVSRSFYEVVGCLSDEYSCLFKHVGVREDKHVRKHDLYQVKSEREAKSATSQAGIDKSTDSLLTPMPVTACLAQKGIEELLSQYLGPIGKVLVRRQMRSEIQPHKAVQELASHIQHEEDRIRFTNKAEKLLLDVNSGSSTQSIIQNIATTIEPQSDRDNFLNTANNLMRGELPANRKSLQSKPVLDTSHWNVRELEIATEHLTNYVGPLSKILVKRVAVHARDMETLYRGLAQHIPNHNERENFLREVGVTD